MLVRGMNGVWKESGQEGAFGAFGEDGERCYITMLGELLSLVLALLLLTASGNKPFGKLALLAAQVSDQSRDSMPAHYRLGLLGKYQTSTLKCLV